jgi:uncharacterized protein (DUF1697 family)
VRYVALLRGIGPGNPKMRNAELVRVLSSAGLRDVTAVISSGNFIFGSGERDRSGLQELIEAALLEHLGAPCAAIVRSRDQMARLCRADVFDDHDDGPTDRCHVTFLQRRPSGNELLPADGDGYRVLGVQRGCVFLVVDSTRSKTPEVMSLMEKVYGKQITTRTWRTVQRIGRGFDG